MTCQECELALAGETGENVEGYRDSIDAHLAECGACREFAGELRANSEAFAALAAESMPALAIPMTPRRPAVRWQWAAAGIGIAAMLALAFLGSRAFFEDKRKISDVPAPVAKAAPVEAVTPQIRPVAAVVRHRAIPRPGRPSQKTSEPKILQIKMLTDDPDVVIYWQIEN